MRLTSCFACGLSLLVLIGTTSPVTADFSIDFLDDTAEIDWTAGSVLGLQRGFKLTRKEVKPKPKLSKGSLLGLQRSTRLQKISAPLVEDVED
ncbi:unnamed protein product, partial [Polarella glacialis]